MERTLLTGYWLLSGYGLRAWRALTALVVLLAVPTALFATVASHPPEFGYRRVPPPPGNPSAFGYEATTELRSRPPWTTALDYSVQSPASLVRPLQNPPALTGWGERWRSSCG